MAYNYSYGEIKDMEADAIRRVQEMHRQSQIATLEIEEEKKSKPNTNIKNNNASSCTYKPQKGNNNLNLRNRLKFLEDDETSEQALLIALLILLMNEKCDTALILAILYILYG